MIINTSYQEGLEGKETKNKQMPAWYNAQGTSKL